MRSVMHVGKQQEGGGCAVSKWVRSEPPLLLVAIKDTISDHASVNVVCVVVH